MGKWLFNPFAPLVSSIVRLRNLSYDAQFIKPVRLRIPVVSIGNITMGGTGKTPFIHWLVDELVKMGCHPGIVTRNYKTKFDAAGWVTSKPESHLQFGDEAVLLKMKNPDRPIYSGPKKWESAMIMEREGDNVDVVLVDDGFQHRRLHRDLDIVLLDVSVSLRDYQWPPVGRARESFSALERADVVVFTRWEQRNEQTLAYLKTATSQIAVQLMAEQVSSSIQWVAGLPLRESWPWTEMKGLAFCGLGNPSSFLQTLKAQGLTIDQFIPFADHTPYDKNRISELIRRGSDFDYLVTSEKDMVKLQEWPSQAPSLCIMPMHLKITGSLEGLREKLAHCFRANN